MSKAYDKIYQGEDDSRRSVIGSVLVSLILLAPGIASFIIAAEYNVNESACNDGTNYRIDLITFLNIAGGICIGYFGIISLTICIGYFCCQRDHRTKLLQCISCLLMLWYVAWASIGLFIYSAEMSNECHEEDIAKMVLAVSLIPLIMIGSVCCCVCCYVAFVYWLLVCAGFNM